MSVKRREREGGKIIVAFFCNFVALHLIVARKENEILIGTEGSAGRMIFPQQSQS